MPNELRVRTNFIGGLVENNPLLVGGTSLTSAALAAVPVIGSTQHFPIVLDPDGIHGAPEIAYITAHTAAATTATIARAQEGTVAREHLRDTPWIHGPTAKDYDASGGGSGLIGVTSYNPATAENKSTTTTAHADADATNLKVDFIVPPSGKVLIRASGRISNANANAEYAWSLRDGAAEVTGTVKHMWYNSSAGQITLQSSVNWLVTGLTPGEAKTYKLGHARVAGTATNQISVGGVSGSFVMEAWAVNV